MYIVILRVIETTHKFVQQRQRAAGLLTSFLMAPLEHGLTRQRPALRVF
jgi:hypothetical protein